MLNSCNDIVLGTAAEIAVLHAVAAARSAVAAAVAVANGPHPQHSLGGRRASVRRRNLHFIARRRQQLA